MAANIEKEKKQPLEKSKKFLREVRAELKKVIWPKRVEVVTSTIVVVVTVIIIGLIISGFDLVFSFLVDLITRG